MRVLSAEAAPEAGAERARFVAIGLIGGLTSGLLGVGGGVVMIPLMVLWLGTRQRVAHAMSLAAIVPISAVGAISYYVGGGTIAPAAAAALALGGIGGARIGAGLLTRIPERPLKGIFGCFLLASAALIGLKA